MFWIVWLFLPFQPRMSQEREAKELSFYCRFIIEIAIEERKSEVPSTTI